MLFEDIVIVGPDKKRTQIAQPGTAMYDVHLTLSAIPPSGWSEIFQHLWDSVLTNMKRRATVRAGHIVITCPLDELQRYHIGPLQGMVANTNAQYREYLKKTAEDARREQERAAAERKRIDDALDNLKL